MIQNEVVIQNSDGLHARPATLFVKLAAKYEADVTLSKNGREVNGKSIMGVMMLAAAKGNKLLLKTEGPDEQEAMKALEELINNKFNQEDDQNEKKS